MAERLSQVKKISGLKGHITRCINKIHSVLAEDYIDKNELKELNETLLDRRDILVNEIYTYLESLEDKTEEQNEFEEKQKEINKLDSKIEAISEEINRALKQIKIDNMTPTVSVNQNKLECQLERIALPKFNGKDYHHWKPIYDAVVHVQSWPDTTKMIRLLSCLEAEPRELLKNYPLVDASYELCLSRLEQVYGGEDRRITEAIRRVRTGKTIDEENLPEVRRFTTTLESAEIALTTSGEDVSNHGALYHCAKERLSPSLLRTYIKWIFDTGVSESFKSLINFMTQWSKILENAPACKRIARPFMTSHVLDTNASTSNNIKNLSRSKEIFIPPCVYHQKEKGQNERHYLDNCALFKALSVKDRRDFTYANRLCKICLKRNHMAKDCRNQRAMCKRCKSGNNKHHFLLHEMRNEREDQIDLNQNEMLESNNCNFKTGGISLQTVPVIIRNGNKKLKINCLIDSGSNSSFISKDVVKALGLTEFNHETRIMNTVTKINEPIKVSKVRFELASVDGQYVKTEEMYSVSSILIKSEPIAWQEDKDNWPHLRSIKFPQLASRPHAEMLIGADLPFYHRCYDEISGDVNGPVAKKLIFGWTCIGRTKAVESNENEDVNCCLLEFDLDEEVSKMWRLEAIGIKEPVNEAYVPTHDEILAEEIISKKLKYKEGKYEAPILWKNKAPEGNNFEAVYKRTKGMERRLEQKGNAISRIDEVVTAYKQKEYIKEVPESQKYEPSYYLPHFAIIKEDRTSSKVRIVFDAAAKYDGKSLNDRILNGGKLQNDMVDIMLKFRKFKYGIIGDISEMFLQIGLSPEDRRFCRFIWRDKIYEWQRTIFGRRDSPYVALYVIKANAQKYQKKYPATVSTILTGMYVDDLVTSCQTEQEVRDLITQTTEIFSNAGMTIHKWNTNSKAILATIPLELRAKASEDILQDEPPISQMLGLSWDANKDDLFFKIQVEDIDENHSCTKREILKLLARLFDPAGLLAAYTLKAKIIFQRSWTERTSWDQPVSQELNKQWLRWHSQLKDLKDIKIPRHIGILTEQGYEIHMFSDASGQAYGGCCYIKTECEVRLIVAKARVSPLRAQSVARLELTGAVLAVRLAKKVCDALGKDIRKVTFWVDAINVLHWLRRPAKEFKPYISNRVSEIQTVVRASQFRYVPTKMNPADMISRPVTAKELKESQFWWSGPDFLRQDEQSWPPNILPPEEEDETNCALVHAVDTTIVCAGTQLMDAEFALNPSRWSNINRLIRRTAYVLRFINKCRRKANETLSTKGKFLHPKELKEAEQLLIRMSQAEAFPEELESLARGVPVSKKSKILKLNPFLDEDKLLRSRSRLCMVTWLSDEFKCPLILPKDHAFTWLIGHDTHERIGHPVGVNASLNELNKRFWIIGARVMMKKIKSKCIKCKINRAKIMQPAMAPIPEFRLAKELNVFSITSVDFGGPFLTKRGRGLARNKRYLVVFTCLQTRLCHLEMATSLETSSFLNTFSRFMSRRGCPTIVQSDGAKNFVKAEKEIREKMLSDKEKLVGHYGNIEWRFLPPYAPNMGGCHEAMVKSAKRALYQILGQADVTDDELETAFVQAESFLNSRPLTGPSDDVVDGPCLTPNHFLIGRANPGNVLESCDKDLAHLHPSKRWKYVQLLTQHFWIRWQRELLHTYITRSKWKLDQPNVKIGDLVMVLDPISVLKRSWRLGRITKTYPGKDGRVRVVDVKTEGKVYRRPVNKLCLLDS